MRRALVVDDDKTILKLVETVLKGLGLQVETAPDAHQALRMLKLLSFDLIVTDANMPSLSGFELLEIVKRNTKNFGEPKIVMCTQRTSKRDHDLALLTGAHKFISKPVDPEQLKSLVVELLGLEQLRAAQDGVNVSEKVRWIDAFEIVRVYADGVEFRSSTLLKAGLQMDLGSHVLSSIASAFGRVEVSSCIAGRKEGEFMVTCRFHSVAEEDRIRMNEWLAAERKVA